MRAKIIFQRKQKKGCHFLRFFFDMQDEAETCYWVFTIDRHVTWVGVRIGEGSDKSMPHSELPIEVLSHLAKQGIVGLIYA